MSNFSQFDLGDQIVPDVDLRLPQTPPPIYFSGGGSAQEIIEAIRHSIGSGEIVAAAGEDMPKYTIFCSNPNGLVDRAVFLNVERCFRQHGNEACVFEWIGFEKKFIRRLHEWFVADRIAE